MVIFTRFWAENLYFFTLLLWKWFFFNWKDPNQNDNILLISWGNFSSLQVWDMCPFVSSAGHFSVKNCQSGFFGSKNSGFGQKKSFLSGTRQCFPNCLIFNVFLIYLHVITEEARYWERWILVITYWTETHWFF